nr:MAG TPA: hypothetical protein [Bacteriophage sp.]DAX75042.1 MAG TPA: hypothetical protein [Caudoviricetes sp.]
MSIKSVFLPLFLKICKKREVSEPPVATLSLLFFQIFLIIRKYSQ